MNTTHTQKGDLGGESSEIRLQKTDTESFMKQTGWQAVARIRCRVPLWHVAEDVIINLESYKDCAFTWSNDRKAIIVWRQS